jgi:hypothetical protein
MTIPLVAMTENGWGLWVGLGEHFFDLAMKVRVRDRVGVSSNPKL